MRYLNNLTLSLTAYFVPLILTACVPEKTDYRGRLLRENGGSEYVRSGRSGLPRDLRVCIFATQPPNMTIVYTVHCNVITPNRARSLELFSLKSTSNFKFKYK